MAIAAIYEPSSGGSDHGIGYGEPRRSN